MKNTYLKVFVCLFSFLFLDMSIPIGFLSKTDFTMIGVIFLAIYLDYRIVLSYTLFFGIAKDALNSYTFPLFTIGFAITIFLIKSLLRYFSGKLYSKFIIVLAAVLFNFIFIAVFSGINFSFYSLLNFALYSLGIFFLINHFLAVWIQG